MTEVMCILGSVESNLQQYSECPSSSWSSGKIWPWGFIHKASALWIQQTCSWSRKTRKDTRILRNTSSCVHIALV